MIRFVCATALGVAVLVHSSAAQTWNSYTPAFPRWFGIALTGRL